MAAPQEKTVVQVPRRRIYTEQWRENQVVNIPLSRDATVVGFHIKLKGSLKYAFSGGSPAGRVEGAMDSIIKAIELNTDRLGVIKYLRPAFLHLQQRAAMGIGSERLYNVGAAATEFPTTEGPFSFGTTGQTTSISETVYLPMEQVFCEPGMGRELTYLNLRRATSANLKFYCGSLQQLNAASGVTGLTFTDVNLSIEVTTVERQDVPETVIFQVWKQIQKTEPFTGKVNDKAIEINTENRLSGLMLYTVRGDKAPTNKLLNKLVLKKNGQENLQEINFSMLQNVNRSDYGIVAGYSAGSSAMDGFAHLTQLSRRELATALDTSRDGGGVFSLQLMVDTNDTSVDANLYTGGTADLYIVTEEITAGK